MYIAGKAKLVTGTDNELDQSFSETVHFYGLTVYIKDTNWGDSLDVEVGYYNATPTWVKVADFGTNVPIVDTATWEKITYLSEEISTVPQPLTIKVRLNQADTTTTKKLLIHYIVKK